MNAQTSSAPARNVKFWQFTPKTVDLPALEAQRLEPGHVVHGFGLHGHRFHEIVLFESGTGVHRVGVEQRAVVPGAIDLLPAGVLHDTSACSEAFGWMILIREDAEVDALDDWHGTSAKRFHADGEALERLQFVAAAMARECEEAASDSIVALRAYFTLLCLELRRLSGGAMTRNRDDSALARRLIDEIDARLHTEIKLVDLANAVGLSPSHLSAMLRTTSGRTAMDWVIARRLRAACRLLLETSDTVSEIAGNTGFADAGHLARRFRAAFGLTPNQWRNHMMR